MFFHNIIDSLKEAGKPLPSKRYIGFKLYPLHDYWALLRHAAQALSPNEPESLGIYRIAQVVYPNFAVSLLGRAIFSVAGREVEKIVSLAPRAYAASNTRGSFIIDDLGPGTVDVTLKDVWDPVPFSVGIWQGVFVVCDIKPRVFEIDVEAPGTLRLRARWDTP